MITAPEFFGVLDNSKVSVTGTVKDVSGITAFTINDNDVPLKFDTHTGLWNFSTEVELKDGYHSIMIAAKDAANNEIEFAHKVFIDTVAPVIKLDSIPKETNKSSIIISGILTDNLPSMKVKVNGNVLKNIAPDWSYFDKLPAAEYKIAYEVDLVVGGNKVIVEASDAAGNVTTQNIIINKAAVVVDPIVPGPVVTDPTQNVENKVESAKIASSNRFKTAIEVSKSGWVT